MKDFDSLIPSPFPERDIQALGKFYEMSRDQVLARLYEREHQVARLWHEAGDPATPEEQAEWYKSSDAHMFEGIAWHSQPTQFEFRRKIGERCRNKTVIDWGCGVATEALIAVGMYDATVTCVDYQNTLDFVRRRYLEWEDGGGAGILYGEALEQDARSAWLRHGFDVVICLDVLEHLPEPERVLRFFRQILKPDGLFIGSAPFSELQWVGHLPEHDGKLLTTMCIAAGLDNVWIDPIRPQWVRGVDT